MHFTPALLDHPLDSQRARTVISLRSAWEAHAVVSKQARSCFTQRTCIKMTSAPNCLTYAAAALAPGWAAGTKNCVRIRRHQRLGPSYATRFSCTRSNKGRSYLHSAYFQARGISSAARIIVPRSSTKVYDVWSATLGLVATPSSSDDSGAAHSRSSASSPASSSYWLHQSHHLRLLGACPTTRGRQAQEALITICEERSSCVLVEGKLGFPGHVVLAQRWNRGCFFRSLVP